MSQEGALRDNESFGFESKIRSRLNQPSVPSSFSEIFGMGIRI